MVSLRVCVLCVFESPDGVTCGLFKSLFQTGISTYLLHREKGSNFNYGLSFTTNIAQVNCGLNFTTNIAQVGLLNLVSR